MNYEILEPSLPNGMRLVTVDEKTIGGVKPVEGKWEAHTILETLPGKFASRDEAARVVCEAETSARRRRKEWWA